MHPLCQELNCLPLGVKRKATGLHCPLLQVADDEGLYLPCWGQVVVLEWFLETVIKSQEEVGFQ